MVLKTTRFDGLLILERRIGLLLRSFQCGMKICLERMTRYDLRFKNKMCYQIGDLVREQGGERLGVVINVKAFDCSDEIAPFLTIMVRWFRWKDLKTWFATYSSYSTLIEKLENAEA